MREALGDDAVTPRYVETIPRRGYRFIAPVEGSPPPVAPSPPRAGRRARWRVVLAVLGILAVALAAYWRGVPGRTPRVVAVLQLTHTGRAEIGGGIAIDGSRVYFTQREGGRWSLAEVSANGGNPAPVALPFPGPNILDISPERSRALPRVANTRGLAQLINAMTNRKATVVPI